MEFKSLSDLAKAIPNEDAAIRYFTEQRWKNGKFCPYCGSTEKIYQNKTRLDRHKCKACNRQFSIRVGTVMEGTKIEIRQWLIAMWLITVHPKGIASTTLAKDLDVQQKTAWFILHRLRHAARTRSFNRQLKGVVEADESFFGGKEQNKHADKRGLKRKAILVGLLERGGELRLRPIQHKGQAADAVLEHVKKGSRLMTDEATPFKRITKHYRREYVTHSQGEYVRFPEAPKSYDEEWGPIIHVNSIEGYWSQLKRQIYGIHHWVSAKHLVRYADESAWRFNRREVPDGARLNEMIARLDGRITFKVLTA